MTFQWTPEAVVAAVGITLASGGALITNAVHWGQTTSQLDTVEQHLHAHDAVLEDHRKQLDAQAVQGAQVGQKLDDLKDQLNRIEKKL